MTTPDFDAFVARLAQTPAPDDAYNPFGAGDNPYNAVRRANLERYLTDLHRRQPRFVLIAEAPGYRGMRLTGMPMVSRRLLREGIPALGLFGLERGYQDVPEPGFENIQSEQSATILWTTLADLGVVAPMWSACPFHPHRPGRPLTNRPPRPAEVRIGAPFVRAVLDLFAPEQVIAVGNVGYNLLSAMGVPCAKIRHPAQGGKRDFVAGLRHLARR